MSLHRVYAVFSEDDKLRRVSVERCAIRQGEVGRDATLLVPPTPYPSQSGVQRIDVVTVCDRCGTDLVLRDVPNTIAARSFLLRDGWTKRGTKGRERWRCPECSPARKDAVDQ